MMMVESVCCSQVVLHVESRRPAKGSRQSGRLAAWNRASELRKNVLMLRLHTTQFSRARAESNFLDGSSSESAAAEAPSACLRAAAPITPPPSSCKVGCATA